MPREEWDWKLDRPKKCPKIYSKEPRTLKFHEIQALYANSDEENSPKKCIDVSKVKIRNNDIDEKEMCISKSFDSFYPSVCDEMADKKDPTPQKSSNLSFSPQKNMEPEQNDR